ncbi:MAG: nucleotidyltransferase domain-containing protein [Nanoarchaeota archaeon]|nr:nucleotidyltransferase domain-containing protein [Nanoarchaeota archaeon]MBU4124227.1 nucleotidyltransferase domain-containing protein [Nanoarchaeota archaeon]
MLEELFSSKARVKILELLIFKQEQLHIREIARRIDVSAPYVIKELNKLKKLNLVAESRIANMKLYRINKASPIYEPLKIIFMRTENLGKHLNETLKNKNMKYALIYGSFASGRETEKSDIDLLIIGSIKQSDIIDAISGFERKMLREVNYIIWTEKELEKRIKEKHHLLVDIAKNPVIMIIGDEDEFRRAVK